MRSDENDSCSGDHRTHRMLIGSEPAASSEPSGGSFDDQEFGQDGKSLGVIRPLVDFDLHALKGFLQRALELRLLVAAIGTKFRQERIKAKQARSQERATIVILSAGAMHDSVHQQTLGVDENAASAPLNSGNRIGSIMPASAVRRNADTPGHTALEYAKKLSTAFAVAGPLTSDMISRASGADDKLVLLCNREVPSCKTLPIPSYRHPSGWRLGDVRPGPAGVVLRMLTLAHQYLDQLRLPLRYLQRAMRQEDASLESPCQTIEEFATSTRRGAPNNLQIGGGVV
jgi:hypothetical protein